MFFAHSGRRHCKTSGKDDTHDTLDELWRHFAKSLHCMWLNKHPYVDSAGLPWPPTSLGASLGGQDVLRDDKFCVLWDINGDLEHHSNVVHMPHWQNADPCWLCRCNRSTRNWMDWRAAASWRATLRTPTQIRAAGPRRHPLFTELVDSGVNDLTIRPGPMHTFDLGLLLYFHGGALRTLVDHATTTVPGSS